MVRKAKVHIPSLPYQSPNLYTNPYPAYKLPCRNSCLSMHLLGILQVVVRDDKIDTVETFKGRVGPKLR